MPRNCPTRMRTGLIPLDEGALVVDGAATGDVADGVAGLDRGAAVVSGLASGSVSTTVSLSYAGTTTTAKIAAAPSEKATIRTDRHGTSRADSRRAPSHMKAVSAIREIARVLLKALVAGSGSSTKKMVNPTTRRTSGTSSYQRGRDVSILGS